MPEPYFARCGWARRTASWDLWKRSKTGDRLIASHMSERTARLVARLLNEHEAVAAASSDQEVRP